MCRSRRDHRWAPLSPHEPAPEPRAPQSNDAFSVVLVTLTAHGQTDTAHEDKCVFMSTRPLRLRFGSSLPRPLTSSPRPPQRLRCPHRLQTRGHMCLLAPGGRWDAVSLWPEACGQQPQRVELSGPGGQELLCSPAPAVWPNPVVSSRRGRWLRQGLRGASAYGPSSSPRVEPAGGKILPHGHSQENRPSNGAPRGTAECREGSTSPRGAPSPARLPVPSVWLQPCSPALPWEA